MSIIPGPVPAYSNLPINADYYEPSRFVISGLTFNGPTTTVTTSTDHNYVVGQRVRLLIPMFYRSRELNEKQGLVISIPASNQVLVNIPSYGATAFDSSPTYAPTSAQILAIGDINTGAINSSGRTNNTTYIQGSFINISPN